MVKRKHGGGCTIEPLEARRMLSVAGIVISSSQPASWSDYAGNYIGGNFSGSWWQGSAGSGTVSLVVGIHNSQGQWVSGTSPYTLMQDNPPVNSPGDSWGLQFSGVDIPTTPGNYTLVATMENTAGNTTAETDFENNVYLTEAVIGNVTALACNPGLTIGNISQTTWNTAVSSTLSGSFNAYMWNGTTNPNNAESLVVGIRNAGGQWVGATEPQDLYDVVPLVGPPGQSQPITFSGLEVPSTAGTYQVVAAEEPFTDSILAFEAAADLGTATVGTVTVSPSATVWGPLLQMQSWNQSGDIVYGSSVTFNQDAPIDPAASGNRSVSGCVATAEAQLAYYWRSMKSLSFSSADAYVSSAGTASQVGIDADSSVDDFPDFATLNSGLADITYAGSPSEMALLEFGLAVKAQADFAYAGTSASVTLPWLQNLGYASAQWSANWAAIEPTVIANIQAGEPVLLQVPDHLCTIDGYNQTNATFHLELGWGGVDDGWYSLPYYGNFAGTTTSGVVEGVAYDLVPATPLAASLAFSSVPATTNGTGFTVSVTLKDATGATATGDTSSVTLAIASGTSGAILGGNLTVAAVNGVATFTNLSLSASGTYTLSAADAAASLAGYVSGNVTVNKGTVSTASIAGTIYADTSDSGVWQAGDPALSNVMVYLDTNDNGMLDAGEISALTNASGNYLFSNLPAGTYTVRQVAPGGYAQSYPAGGAISVTLVAGQAATGQTFLDAPAGQATEEAVYRLYSPVTLEHLYTTDPNEYNTLESYVGTWNGEGEVFSEYSGPATVGGVTDEPFYRLYNPFVRQHLWTTDLNEYTVLATEGWNQEGIVGYVFPAAAGSTAASLAAVPNSQALYRLMAPQVHLWTTSLNEYDTLQTEGWTGEGIIGYVL